MPPLANWTANSAWASSRTGTHLSRERSGSTTWSTLPVAELALGLVLVAISIKISAGGEFSLGRTAVLLVVCGLIALYGFIRNPYAPFYCYAFVTPIFVVFGSGIALILAGAVLVFLDRRRAQWQWQFSHAGLAFCFWSTAGLIWSGRHYFGQDSFLAQTVPAMILAIVISGIRSPLFRRNIILMVVGACAIGSAFSLRHYLQGTGEYGNGRTFALIQPDVFSAWEIFGFLGALVWLLRENSPIWLRGILIVSLLLIIAGIGLCGERAAILAGALGLFVVCICQKLVRQGLLIVAAVAAGALLLYVVEPDMFAPVLSRFDTIQEDRGSERLDIWTAALRVFCEAPIIGAGCDNFQFVVSRHLGEQVMSHSIYVGTLVELGIIGFAFLVAWIGVLLRKTWQAQDRLWVFPLLMVYLVQAAFLHEFYFSCFWLALGLAEGAAPARGSGASAQPQPVQQRLAGPPRSTRRGIGMSRIVPARMLRVGTWLSHNSMRPRAGDGRQ